LPDERCGVHAIAVKGALSTEGDWALGSG
jgi:hypothetical protein